MTKALFFDIDGTLVAFKTHSIPASTIEAISKAKENGVEVYISTGRPYPLINNLAAISSMIDGYITTNGAYCFIGDHVVSCTPIDAKAVDAILDKSRIDGFPCMVVGEHRLTMFNTASAPEKVSKVSRLLNVPTIETELPIEEVLSERILQLTPFIDVEQEKQLLEALPDIESGRWCADFTDITAKGVCKAKGLRVISRYRGIPIPETMAFGDGGNDLSIIREAGVGVAMGNSNDILLENADYITTSVDDDGVYNALKHFGVI